MAVHRILLQADVAEIPSLLDWVEQCCGIAGVPQRVFSRLQLAIEEAVVNIIRHAFGDQPPPQIIELQLDIRETEIVAELIDNGASFNPCAKPAPDCTLSVAARDIGGLGIHLMRKMVDRLEYRREDGRNHLRLETTRAVPA